MKLPQDHARLFTKSEWKLLRMGSQKTRLSELTPKQKKVALTRLRKLNTKYRDLSRQQAAKAVKTKGYRSEQISKRTKKKAALVRKVCSGAR